MREREREREGLGKQLPQKTSKYFSNQNRLNGKDGGRCLWLAFHILNRWAISKMDKLLQNLF